MVKEAEGVRLYSSDVTGVSHIKVKAVAVVDADINSITAVLDDVAGNPDWFPYLIETRVLGQQSDADRLLYSRFDATWPARDRDVVYRVRVVRHEDGSVVYQQQSQQSPLMPEQDDYVRAILMRGSYRLMPIDVGQTQVELLLDVDPRGKLPQWIVNIIKQKMPFELLKGLRRQLTETE